MTLADWEKMIVPLDEAHEVLHVFGIGPSSREYQRWRRDDGFRHVDFEGVLRESRSVVALGEKFRWEEQFGYKLTPKHCNLNASRDGFEFDLTSRW